MKPSTLLFLLAAAAPTGCDLPTSTGGSSGPLPTPPLPARFEGSFTVRAFDWHDVTCEWFLLVPFNCRGTFEDLNRSVCAAALDLQQGADTVLADSTVQHLIRGRLSWSGCTNRSTDSIRVPLMRENGDVAVSGYSGAVMYHGGVWSVHLVIGDTAGTGLFTGCAAEVGGWSVRLAAELIRTSVSLVATGDTALMGGDQHSVRCGERWQSVVFTSLRLSAQRP